jgi:hypothetical protein
MHTVRDALGRKEAGPTRAGQSSELARSSRQEKHRGRPCHCVRQGWRETMERRLMPSRNSRPVRFQDIAGFRLNTGPYAAFELTARLH